MQPWVVGLVVVVLVGVAVLAYGALADRSRTRRRTAEMLSPPSRVIPHLPPGTSPRYLSELQARRRPEGTPSPGGPASPTLLEEGTRVEAGWASKDFATDRAQRQAVLEQPAVLVCSDAVTTVRELLPVLERVLAAGIPLVLVAPEVDPQVLATLEVNVIQDKMRLLVVLADAERRGEVADLSGATPVDRSDRQSGHLAAAQLGHLERWVATREASVLRGVAG